jgi:hypothetical protein
LKIECFDEAAASLRSPDAIQAQILTAIETRILKSQEVAQ